MKSLLFNLFVVTLFFCLSVQYGSGLSCYECNDHIATTPCKNMTSKMIKNCGNKDHICTAEWSFDKLFGRNVTYIRRACINATMTNRRVVFKTPQTTVMYCSTELCNTAVGVPTTTMVLFISAVMSLFFCKDRY